MKSLNAGRCALQWFVCLALLTVLNGCHKDGAATYTVGGMVSGLAPGAKLALSDNNSNPLDISGNGAFSFSTQLASNAAYRVTISAQPTGQTCTVTAGTGTIGTANVASVAVACSDQTYMVGGTIKGLTGPGLVLANGSATVAVPSGAQSFILPAAIAYNSSYSITVKVQPKGLACAVTAGSGTVPAHAVTSIVVTCVDQDFTIGGTVTGLGAHSGLALTNGTDTVNVPANATGFSMPTAVASGTHYDVTVQTQPASGVCAVNNGSGIVAGAAVTNVVVACVIYTESLLYSFAGAPSDGAEPWYGSLILAADGNFYGMTAFGGTHDDGTVFKLTPAGVETVLWSFGNGNDGSNPYGSLIQASDGNFYGMTNLGGLYGRGTVFKITPTGVETVLWSFGNGTDGSSPYGSLIEGSDGNFYGLTYIGGIHQGYVGNVYQGGTVFKITPTGVETVLWSFGNGNDGSMPYGKLSLGPDGNFYSMTYVGGVNGKGTVFKITPAGAETVLWSFGASGDGAHPTGSTTLGTDGNFYGMTIDGGANDAGSAFKITPSGTETVLHSFGGPGDGNQPQGSLILGADGNFYGVTGTGGSTGLGTILEITPGGAESVIYSFGSGPNGTGSDGDSPFGGLIQGPDGTLYGMTSRGGTHDKGTVFKIK